MTFILRSGPPVRHVPKDASRHKTRNLIFVGLFVVVDIALIIWAVTAFA